MMTKNHWGDALPDTIDLPVAAPDARPDYGRIDFEKLPNTRDLGGMVAPADDASSRGFFCAPAPWALPPIGHRAPA